MGVDLNNIFKIILLYIIWFKVHIYYKFGSNNLDGLDARANVIKKIIYIILCNYIYNNKWRANFRRMNFINFRAHTKAYFYTYFE